MEPQRNKIAIVAPSRSAYSETFIQAQKNGLKGQVFYYYGGYLPSCLEHFGALLSKKNVLYYKIKKKISGSGFSLKELAFITSLKQKKVQVVLAQYGPTAHRILKVCKHLRLPLITHFHGFDASEYKVIERCNNYEEVFEYSSKIIVVSEVMKKDLENLGCPADKIVYNPCVPQSEFVETQAGFSKKQLVAVGRFINKKGPYYTILAFKQVIDNHPETRLVMAGDGELLEVCKNLVRYYEIEDKVLFLGVISAEKYRALLKESLAFVQHSVRSNNGDMEGTPVAVLEASAAGLPVISTLHAGIPDAIIHGKTGLLCEEHDVNTMSIYMEKILGDLEYAKELGRAGKENVKKNFNMKKHLDVLETALIEAI